MALGTRMGGGKDIATGAFLSNSNSQPGSHYLCILLETTFFGILQSSLC
jgi:hypothetical protein